MRKNPFSIHDFLGYVFPGALTLFLFYLQTQSENATRLYDYYILLGKLNYPDSLEDTIILTILSYVLGHLIAYLSSVTVERFSIWVYDYPSHYLIERMPKRHFLSPFNEYHTLIKKTWKRSVLHNDNWCIRCWKYIRIIFSYPKRLWEMLGDMFWRFFFSLFLLPISLGTLIVSWMLGLKNFLVKPLDDDLRKTVRFHTKALMAFLGIKGMKRDSDFHRIIYHYEYEQMNAHSIKMDNYVALYGFIRATAFIFNILCFWILVTVGVPAIFDNSFDSHLFLMLFVLGSISYIFFLAFMKFYRRFTLESLMSLVSDTSYYTQRCANIGYSQRACQQEDINSGSETASESVSDSDETTV